MVLINGAFRFWSIPDYMVEGRVGNAVLMLNVLCCQGWVGEHVKKWGWVHPPISRAT